MGTGRYAASGDDSDSAQRLNTIRSMTLRYPTLTGSALADGEPASFSSQSQLWSRAARDSFGSQGISSNFLFESYTGAVTTLFAGAQTMVLDDGVYAGVRDEVQSKLKEQIQQFILSIPI